MSFDVPLDLPAGSRLRTKGGERCTLRYLGPCPGQEGTWLGVEWDEPSRGKHSGTITDKDGVKHKIFQTQVANSGSLIKWNTGQLQIGRSFYQAIQEKYFDDNDVKDLKCDTFYSQSGREIPVVTLGLEEHSKRVANFGHLVSLSLAGTLVSHAGDNASLTLLTLEKMTELDISASLVNDLEIVNVLANRFPSLRSVKCNDNKISLDPTTNFECQSITSLQLNNTSRNVADLVRLDVHFPNLVHLEIGYNGIQSLPPHLKRLQSLLYLDLSANELSSWEDISSSIGQLKNLEILLLNKNRLCEIRHLGGFRRLEHLELASNPINDMHSLDELNKMHPRTLRLTDIPLLDECTEREEAKARATIIARIQTIKVLNRSEVSSEERQSAERYHASSAVAPDPGFTHLNGHLRHSELTQHPLAPAESSGPVRTSSVNLFDIDVSLVNRDGEVQRTIQARLSKKANVKTLRGTLARLLGLRSSGMTMTAIWTTNNVPLKVELDDLLQTLDHYQLPTANRIDVWSH